ncbi:branched-chain amino acid ABC transporter substrate-binding protein [Herbaspirillum robiniae]|uniref:Branched chain amino acid ABC transporter substrate-binding protein n=1 Tax=Herbaspirillum robiniae TaxID=2014887 RepID=A0A246WWF3_9BURK|nr:branched-chain amino acid ABC transporter substrate-binding protein [Herbaspirillum robiniae]OWY31395.1 branched chain amino acid ABC transporter substrate-binding protein [Herbaspirillum robiniae]
MRRNVSALLAVLLLAPLAGHSATAPAPAGETSVAYIGFACALTSPVEASVRIGRSMANAAQLAVNAANRQKIRINGKQVTFELITQSDNSDLRTAPIVAEYFVRRGVIGVIGHGNSGTSMAASAVYSRAGIPQLAPSASSRAYTQQGFQTTFRMVGHTERAGRYLAQYAVKTAGLRRIAVIDNGIASGHAFAETFAQAVRAQGGNILSHDSVSYKTSDFSNILNAARNGNPDAIFWGGLYDQAVILAQAMQRLNINIPLITGANSIISPRFPKDVGALANRIISLEASQPIERLKGWKSFQRSYEEEFGSYIDPYAPLAYDAAQVLIAAVRQANSLAPEKITEALHSIRFNGLTGAIAFNGEGDLAAPVFSIYELRDQQWQLLQVIDGK